MVQLVKERYTPLLDLLTFHYVNIEKHLGLAKLNTIEVNETTGVTSMAKSLYSFAKLSEAEEAFSPSGNFTSIFVATVSKVEPNWAWSCIKSISLLEDSFENDDCSVRNRKSFDHKPTEKKKKKMAVEAILVCFLSILFTYLFVHFTQKNGKKKNENLVIKEKENLDANVKINDQINQTEDGNENSKDKEEDGNEEDEEMNSLKMEEILMECIQSSTLPSGKIYELDLSYQKFKTIPIKLFEMENLKQLQLLNLSDNLLVEIDPRIWILENITSLNLRYNQLKQIPSEVSKLKNLTELRLQSNFIEKIPESICQLHSLAILDLTKNSLTNLPNDLQGLIALEELFLHNNSLADIPESISTLENLRLLYLGQNNLKYIPNLRNLKNLVELDISENQLCNFPKGLGKLVSLEVLEVSDNMIDKVPPEIGNLQKLTTLNLRSNNLKYLPAELLDIKGIRSVNLNQNPFLTYVESFNFLFEGTKFNNEEYLQQLYFPENRKLMLEYEELHQEKIKKPNAFIIPSKSSQDIQFETEVFSLKELCGRLILELNIPIKRHQVPSEILDLINKSSRCSYCNKSFLQTHYIVLKMLQVWMNFQVPFLFRFCSKFHLEQQHE